ncbi:MAG: hypothetical protein ACLR1P_00680 [Oscillospiraceae bacterium]
MSSSYGVSAARSCASCCRFAASVSPAGGQRTGRRVELALPGRDLGRRSVERLLPGGELRLCILQLLPAAAICAAPSESFACPASYACTSDSMEYPVPISCVS